ncbi:MAG TPA: polysaccharide deacetylase family protein [bacterium]|nr:polysaccharide deacetylase family protein [bacterium]HQG44801.1 polysaccharide deacetylase family protein [bacterium]HQI48169.1 polysaccharide deacetylase family protein [bacterium]HQJ65712.1 polysaccharide deacetylase family protein [bacterium]
MDIEHRRRVVAVTRRVRIFAGVLLLALFDCKPAPPASLRDHGALIRGDTGRRALALIFTGGDFADGGPFIRQTLADKGIQAGFFFTGDFYRDPAKSELIRALIRDGHYLGPHSDQHLLYAAWEKRDSSLVTREQFTADLLANYAAMAPFGLPNYPERYFIPPYEWYNREQVAWAAAAGITLFNFTPGTSSNADYTTPEMRGYRSSQAIWEAILAYEKRDPHGLNGFILLIHVGTDPRRTDKFYLRLGDLIDLLRRKGYSFQRIDALLRRANR